MRTIAVEFQVHDDDTSQENLDAYRNAIVEALYQLDSGTVWYVSSDEMRRVDKLLYDGLRPEGAEYTESGDVRENIIYDTDTLLMKGDSPIKVRSE